MHAQQTAQMQQQQTADLQWIWDQRELERTQAEAKRGADLLQQQEAARKAAEEEARAAQAKAADQQAKTDALLQAVLLHLQESKLATTRTPQLEAPSPIPATTTATSSSSVPSSESSAELQWDTPPSLLPSQWIQHQLDFRARALDQMLDGSSRDTAPFLEAFHNTRQRPPRLDDLPHWQQLDLAPNPAHTDFHSVYLPVLLNVTLRMAQLNHPPVIANPSGQPIWPNWKHIWDAGPHSTASYNTRHLTRMTKLSGPSFKRSTIERHSRTMCPHGTTSSSRKTSSPTGLSPGQSTTQRPASTCYAH